MVLSRPAARRAMRDRATEPFGSRQPPCGQRRQRWPSRTVCGSGNARPGRRARKSRGIGVIEGTGRGERADAEVRSGGSGRRSPGSRDQRWIVRGRLAGERRAQLAARDLKRRHPPVGSRLRRVRLGVWPGGRSLAAAVAPLDVARHDAYVARAEKLRGHGRELRAEHDAEREGCGQPPAAPAREIPRHSPRTIHPTSDASPTRWGRSGQHSRSAQVAGPSV